MAVTFVTFRISFKYSEYKMYLICNDLSELRIQSNKPFFLLYGRGTVIKHAVTWLPVQ